MIYKRRVIPGVRGDDIHVFGLTTNHNQMDEIRRLTDIGRLQVFHPITPINVRSLSDLPENMAQNTLVGSDFIGTHRNADIFAFWGSDEPPMVSGREALAMHNGIIAMF